MSGSVRTFQNAMVLMPVAILLNVLFAGFFVNLDNFVDFVQWIRYIVFLGYTYHGLSYLMLKDVEWTCNDNERIPPNVPFADRRCPVENGNQVMAMLGVDDYHPQWDVLALAVILVVFLFIAQIPLKRKTRAI